LTIERNRVPVQLARIDRRVHGAYLEEYRAGDSNMSDILSIQEALQRFAESVKSKASMLIPGEPGHQLRGPFENFMNDLTPAIPGTVVCTGKTGLYDLGKPDYAVHVNKLFAGYVELKSPGTGANPKRFTGNSRQQWKRFRHIPNLIYCDGNEWALCRNGRVVHRIVRLAGDLMVHGKRAVAADDAHKVGRLLQDFLSWEPSIPRDRKGKIDSKGLAGLLAPLCAMMRDDVANALLESGSPLVQLAKDWRQLLVPEASDDRFADAYAQTVTFALLLGRSEGADPLTLESAEAALAIQHSLLSRSLQILTTGPSAKNALSTSLDLLLRVIGAVPPSALTGTGDPWLHFYEYFLAAYNPELRKHAGAYYTPTEVVRAQVRLIDDLLVNRLGKPRGFLDPGVVTLDPATGTGTYLLGVIEHALSKVHVEEGAGAVPVQAAALAENLYGFEIMAGPFAVSELRVSRALLDWGAAIPSGGSQIYLTDRLESPNTEPPLRPLSVQAIADLHLRSCRLKRKNPVLVCLGNPPYERHEAAVEGNKARAGGWIRWGDDGKGTNSIFRSFLDPAVAAGHAARVKNLYNLYVYFWRWALWEVFERDAAHAPGVVSFISASSYLDGDAFCGMREHMRRLCDEIWILDLGGEGRGTRKSDNVFSIQTPVAIAIAVRAGKTQVKRPARIHYARIDGSREAKLNTLDDIRGLSSLTWQDCPDHWQASFRPPGTGQYFAWPLITDLMPWQHSGVQFKRTWPICPDQATLAARWRALVTSADRAEALRETVDRKISGHYAPIFAGDPPRKPIGQELPTAPSAHVRPYAYRSFDRQWIFADNRVGDRLRPDLWCSYSERQIYLTSLFSQPLGAGPAVVAAAFIPDLDHFRGSYGAKAAIPLYRNAEATDANVLPGLLDLLGKTYGLVVSPEDFLAYVYGVLAHPGFTERFDRELETRELRAPITKEASLFVRVRDMGARLLWVHTFGQRFVAMERPHGRIPRGATKCIKAVPGNPEDYPVTFEHNDAKRTLSVGAGAFHPVAREVFEFEVSGLKVVQSWLKYRMKKGSGRKSSPLDDIRPERWPSQFTSELLELLWVLETTIDGYPEQAELLSTVIAADCFQADEFSVVPAEARKP
jgi:hypothetical protein